VFPEKENDKTSQRITVSGPKHTAAGPTRILEHERRRQFHRRLLLFVHAIVAFGTAILFLNTFDLAGFNYWRRGAGTASILMASPSLLPYIISTIHSWRTATYSRLRTAAFLAVLVAGAFAAMCAIVGAFGLSVTGTDLYWIFAIQAAVYFFSAEFLFDLD
jgi:hypothetical protein